MHATLHALLQEFGARKAYSKCSELVGLGDSCEADRGRLRPRVGHSESLLITQRLKKSTRRQRDSNLPFISSVWKSGREVQAERINPIDYNATTAGSARGANLGILAEASPEALRRQAARRPASMRV